MRRLVDTLAQAPPMIERPDKAKLLHALDPPIERNPGHDFRMGKMAVARVPPKSLRREAPTFFRGASIARFAASSQRHRRRADDCGFETARREPRHGRLFRRSAPAVDGRWR